MDIKLYNGEVTLRYDDEKHTYTDLGNDEILTGVTSVLGMIDKSEKLVPWAVKTDLNYAKEKILKAQSLSKREVDSIFKLAATAHDRSRDDSAEFGTYVHALVEDYVKGKEMSPTEPEAIKRLDQFKEIHKSLNLEVVESEKVIHSRLHRYAGTTDLLVLFKGDLYVGDIKTNSVNPYYKKSGVYLSHWLQTAAYQKALEEELGLNIKGRMVFRLGEDGYEVAFQDNSTLDDDFGCFLAAQTIYKRVKQYDRQREGDSSRS